MRRLCVVAVSLLVLAGFGGTANPTVRPPTPSEHGLIVHAVTATWSYESRPIYDRHVRPPGRPHVLRIAVNRADPRYATAVVELRDARGNRRGSPMVLVFERGRDFVTRKPAMLVIGGPAVAFSEACTSGTPAGIRALICPDPWSVLGYARPRIHAQSSYTQPIAVSDLHRLDWRKVLLPGAVCGSTRPIRYSESSIRPDAAFVWWNPVLVGSWMKPVFGDLDGDGRDEAAVGVVCANGGSTADGQLAFSAVIFKAVNRSLRVVGIVTPRQSPFDPSGVHVPLAHVTSIERGRITMSEQRYGSYDGTCCPSGVAKTTWAYRDGKLTPTRTVVLRKPWSSPILVQDALVEPGDQELGDDPKPHIIRSPGLRVVVTLASYGPVKRNVTVTLGIHQPASTILRTTKVARVPLLASGKVATVVFADLGRPALWRPSTITLDIRDRGAFPIRYPATFWPG